MRPDGRDVRVVEGDGIAMPKDHDDDADSDADFDFEEILGDSNAGAYQRAEERIGPPLEYVAEKSRHAIEQIHAVYLQLGDESSARGPAQAAFHYALVAYLALNNMLTLAGDHRVVSRLLAMPPDVLIRWLDAVDAEGSVTG
jgi:hypothetical protein